MKPYAKHAAFITAALLAGANIAAFFHSRAMTRLIDSGTQTPRPENLSLFQKARVLATGITLKRPRAKKTPADLGMKFISTRIPVEGGNLHAWELSEKTTDATIFLFHGYGGEKSSLLEEAREFQRLGFHVILTDFLGYGESDGNTTTLGVREARQVAAVVDAFRKRHPGTKIVLYGESMGAAAVLRAAGVLKVPAQGIIVESSFGRLLDTVKQRFRLMGIAPFPLAHLLLFWGGLQHGFNAFRHNPVEYARGITQPTLLAHGLKDPRVSARAAQSIYENLAGPKEILLLLQAGHGNLLDQAPNEWRATVTSFLERYSLRPKVP